MATTETPGRLRKHQSDGPPSNSGSVASVWGPFSVHTAYFVVEYRQRPIKSIRGGLQEAAKRAGLAYGRAGNGVTFHTLRHTAASLLAELGESEAIRKEVMGHRDIATTQRYTQLRPVHEIPALERLAAAVPISDLVMDPRRRASNKPVGKSVGTLSDTDRQTPTKTGSVRQTLTVGENSVT
jgi:integrase